MAGKKDRNDHTSVARCFYEDALLGTEVLRSLKTLGVTSRTASVSTFLSSHFDAQQLGRNPTVFRLRCPFCFLLQQLMLLVVGN